MEFRFEIDDLTILPAALFAHHPLPKHAAIRGLQFSDKRLQLFLIEVRCFGQPRRRKSVRVVLADLKGRNASFVEICGFVNGARGRGDYLKNFGHVRAKFGRRKMGRNLQKMRKEPEAQIQTQPTIKWTVPDDREDEDGHEEEEEDGDNGQQASASSSSAAVITHQTGKGMHYLLQL
jgi:hypothetical protein